LKLWGEGYWEQGLELKASISLEIPVNKTQAPTSIPSSQRASKIINFSFILGSSQKEVASSTVV
jgi:hypothetical protein